MYNNKKKLGGIIGGIVIKWLILKPKKPSSSQRKVVKVKLNKNKKIIYGYIEGETKNERLLKEYNIVLLNRKGKKDVVNVNYRILRGVKDMISVKDRLTNRSQYGIKKYIYKKKDNYNIIRYIHQKYKY